MNMLNDEEMGLLFSLEEPVYVEGIGDFYAPLLVDIGRLTEKKYFQCLSAILYDKNESGQENLEQYTNFEIVMSYINQDGSFKELFFCALKLHFRKTPFLHDLGVVYFDELTEESFISEEKFEYIRKLISVANKMSTKKEEYEPANEQARKLIEKIKKRNREQSQPAKQTMSIKSLISGVGWKSKNTEGMKKLNIYQLYDGLDRLPVIDYYDYINIAISAGTLNQKDVNLSEIHWANIINK